MFGSLGLPEIAIIAVIVFMIFGPARLPKLGRSIGETIREFRKVKHTLQEADAEVKHTVNEFKS